MSQKLSQIKPENGACFAILPAAGIGARMGSAQPKQYLEIAGKTVLQHSVQGFLDSPAIKGVFVVVSADDAYVDSTLKSHPKLAILRCGGQTRRDTVYNALRHLHESAIVGDHDWILVHDAARPGLTSRLINKLIEELSNDAVGGLLALPVVDTVKRLADGKLQTVPRDGLWLAQTPQMFRHALLLKALENSNDVTDEASAIEQLGLSPRLVEGHANNRKITLPEDLIFFRQHLSL